MTKQGGSVANETGNILEDFVKAMLEDREYQFIERNKFVLATNGLEQKIYTEQIHLTATIYDTKWNIDFLLHNPAKLPLTLIIKCKWQQVGGSVDEKYPYLNENIKKKSVSSNYIIGRRWI